MIAHAKVMQPHDHSIFCRYRRLLTICSGCFADNPPNIVFFMQLTSEGSSPGSVVTLRYTAITQPKIEYALVLEVVKRGRQEPKVKRVGVEKHSSACHRERSTCLLLDGWWTPPHSFQHGRTCAKPRSIGPVAQLDRATVS